MWVSPSRAAQAKGGLRAELLSACSPSCPSGEVTSNTAATSIFSLSGMGTQLIAASHVDFKAMAFQNLASLQLRVGTPLTRLQKLVYHLPLTHIYSLNSASLQNPG